LSKGDAEVLVDNGHENPMPFAKTKSLKKIGWKRSGSMGKPASFLLKNDLLPAFGI
jgi:hypothetical protein